MITVKQLLELNVGDKIIDNYTKETGIITMFNKVTNVFSVRWQERGTGLYHISSRSFATPESRITFFNLPPTSKQLEFEF